MVGGQLGGTWERRASDPADNEGEDAGADRAEIRATLRGRGGVDGGMRADVKLTGLLILPLVLN